MNKKIILSCLLIFSPLTSAADVNKSCKFTSCSAGAKVHALGAVISVLGGILILDGIYSEPHVKYQCPSHSKPIDEKTALNNQTVFSKYAPCHNLNSKNIDRCCLSEHNALVRKERQKSFPLSLTGIALFAVGSVITCISFCFKRSLSSEQIIQNELNEASTLI